VLRLPAARFSLLYAAQFVAVGVMLPFFPAVLADRGLSATEVSAVLALGSAVRLLAGPLGGRVADALGDVRRVLALAAGLAAVTALGFALPLGFAALLLVQALHASAIAPVVPLTDALAVRAARGGSGFDYARVRAAGSVAFILAALLAGQAVEAAGVGIVVWVMAASLAATALAAGLVPAEPTTGGGARGWAGFLAPLRIPAFRLLLPVSALIQASHAFYYAFGTIHWQAAGLSPGLIGVLWSVGVVAEIGLFLVGRRLTERLGPVGLSLLAASAGVVRWGVTAETAWVPALLVVQVLHGATFGAQHLASMAVIGRVVPPAMAGTAQTLHGSFGVGLWMGVLVLLSGPLYAAVGGQGFWAMAALCAAALPAALLLRGALR
jgi:PPP family 3-phenylpropionic acid transporter